MALPANFLEELRARTPLAALIGRRVKLARSGRQWKGCCPFHGEKSPSFYVYDDHFHCFGCGAHGDAIGFVMQSAGSSFMEAVEQLASEAGLDVPKPTPEAAEQERRRHDLHMVVDAARQWFESQLYTPEGRAGLSYLRDRGLTDATIRDFGLGWAGEGRGALAAALARDGIEPRQMLEAGLLREVEHGPARDVFFNRVIFPIWDRRGRTISFGGRTLGDGQPKYVNGPETALFSKRRNLYALDRAREGVKHGPLVAVEGYMDVIALHQAGFTGAVAPLGTALTSDQLEEMWRISPSVTLCFDGDAAGSRAVMRAMDQALPLLQPDRALMVARLPPGEDPDSLLRRGGPPAFQAVLNAAAPLSRAMFGALREGTPATPEGRAQFRNRLMEAAGRVADKALSGEYRREWLDLFFQARPGRRGAKPAKPSPQRQPPSLEASTFQRQNLLTAILLHHPGLIADVHDAFCRLDLPEPLHRLRHALLDWSDHTSALDSAQLIDHLRSLGLESDVDRVFTAVATSLPACGQPNAMPAEAEAGWWHFFELMHPGGLEAEIRAAEMLFLERTDESVRRLIALRRAQNALRRGEHGMETTD